MPSRPSKRPRNLRAGENVFGRLFGPEGVFQNPPQPETGLRPSDPGALEAFMESPAAGFMGGGALGTLKNLTGISNVALNFGPKIKDRFPQFEPTGFTKEGVPIANPKNEKVFNLLLRALRQRRQTANDQGGPLPGSGFARRGGETPTDKELFDMAIRVQREPADVRSFEKFMAEIRSIMDELTKKPR